MQIKNSSNLTGLALCQCQIRATGQPSELQIESADFTNFSELVIKSLHWAFTPCVPAKLQHYEPVEK